MSGAEIITPDALIVRLDARDRQVAERYDISGSLSMGPANIAAGDAGEPATHLHRSENTARSVGDCAPGVLFDAPDHPAACDLPFHNLGNT